MGFVEERRLGTVEILGCFRRSFLAKYPAGEADDAARGVCYREHIPVPKFVYQPPPFVPCPVGSLLSCGFLRKTRFNDFPVGELFGLEKIRELAPRIACKTEAEFFHGRILQSALFEILLGRI